MVISLLLITVPPEEYRSLSQQLDSSMREKNNSIEKAKIELYDDLGLSDILPSLSSNPKTCPLSSSITLNCVYEGLLTHYKYSLIESEPLNISFLLDGNGSAVEAKDGTIISSMKVSRPPQVSYKSRSKDSFEHNYFTLVLSDPDCPSKVYPSMRLVFSSICFLFQSEDCF